jgi:WD40 repeat protein
MLSPSVAMIWCSRCGRVLDLLPGALAQAMQQLEGTACSSCGTVLCETCNPTPSQGGSLVCARCGGSLDPLFVRDLEKIHGKLMAAILAWAGRFRERPIRVEIGNRSATTASSTREEVAGAVLFFDPVADGRLTAVAQDIPRPGHVTLQFDSHVRGTEVNDRLLVGYEVSGVDDEGERLVVHKGAQVIRLVARPESPEASAGVSAGNAAEAAAPAGYTVVWHDACTRNGCERCGGQGYFLVREPAARCPTCRGRGYAIRDEIYMGPDCGDCLGTGWADAILPQSVTGTVAVAAGVPVTGAASSRDGILVGHSESVLGCAVSPDGAWIVSAEVGYPKPGAIKVWDTGTGACLHTLPGETSAGANLLVASPDGAWFAASIGSAKTDEYGVRVWDIATGTCRLTLLGHAKWVRGCAVSPDGGWLVSASYDHTLRIWDTTTGACRRTLVGHEADVYACAASNDGSRIISAGEDGTVRVWDVASGRCRQTIRGHDGDIHAIAESPDGTWLVSAGGDGTLRVWDVGSGRCRHVLAGHRDAVFYVCVSPDGSWIVSACSPVLHGSDIDLRVWDTATGACRHVLTGHTGWITSVHASPDGRWVVSTSRDGTLRIWDPRAGTCIRTLAGHEDGVTSTAVSADSHWIISTSYDRTVRIWDVETGACRLPRRPQGAVDIFSPAPKSAVEPPALLPSAPEAGPAVRGESDGAAAAPSSDRSQATTGISSPGERGGVRGLIATLHRKWKS